MLKNVSPFGALVFLSLTLPLTACSSTKPASNILRDTDSSGRARYQVSVSSDGIASSSLDDQLILHLSVAPKRAATLKSDLKKLQLTRKRDSQGGTMGWTVGATSPFRLMQELSIAPGDLLTGVGPRRIIEANDLLQLSDFLKLRETSITFERDGKPRKVFLAIAQPAAPEPESDK